MRSMLTTTTEMHQALTQSKPQGMPLQQFVTALLECALAKYNAGKIRISEAKAEEVQ